jgi:putative ABC transport system substrate-binding protein
VISFAVSRAEDLGGAFEAMVRDRVNGLIVLTSPLFTQRETRVEIADLARKNGLPAITLFTTFPSFGLLLAYGPDQLDAYRRVASDYVPRILKGARTADLPIQRPEKFRLVINTK